MHWSVRLIHQALAGLIVVMSKFVLLTEVEATGMMGAIENVVRQCNGTTRLDR